MFNIRIRNKHFENVGQNGEADSGLEKKSQKLYFFQEPSGGIVFKRSRRFAITLILSMVIVPSLPLIAVGTGMLSYGVSRMF